MGSEMGRCPGPTQVPSMRCLCDLASSALSHRGRARGISSMGCMCWWLGTLNTRRETPTALMVTPLFVENRTGILFGSTVHIRNRTTDFWHTTSLVHAYGKSDDDDMMTVLSNLMVRAPKKSLSSPCTSSGRRPSTFLS